MTIDKGINTGAGTGAAGERGSRSPIEFRLDPGSGVPTYLQLVQQVEQALRLGYLKPGDQLPTVKDTVAFLAINPNTVLKAYRELEHRGLAGGRPGQGTFVEGTLGKVGLPEQTELRRVLLGWLRTADAAGLDEAGMIALFTSALRDFHDRRGGRPASGGGPSVARGRRSRRGSGDDRAEGVA
jgi:GntR family transcriptional regulator